MPVNCQTTVLTGQDGALYFQPAGTQFCLLDYTDFPAGSLITLPTGHDFKVGDPVRFTRQGTSTLDTALTASQLYYIVATGLNFCQVSATNGGSPITLNGNGGVSPGSGIASLAAATAGVGYKPGTYYNVQVKQGINVTARATVVVPGGGGLTAGAITITAAGVGYTNTAGSISLTGGNDGTGNAIDTVAPTTAFAGTATLTTRNNTQGTGNHILIDYANFMSVAQVRGFQLQINRDEIETTSIPSGTTLTTASKYVRFKTFQSNFADGSGSMDVQFTSDQAALSQRLLANVLLRNQAGAEVKLYISHVIDASGTVVDDVNSMFIQAPISITSMNITGNTSDSSTATLNFRVSGQPTRLLGIDLA